MKKKILALIAGLVALCAHAKERTLIVSRDDVVKGYIGRCYSTDSGGMMELWTCRDTAIGPNIEATVRSLHAAVPYSRDSFRCSDEYAEFTLCGTFIRLLTDTAGQQEFFSKTELPVRFSSIQDFVRPEQVDQFVYVSYDATARRFVPVVTEQGSLAYNWGLPLFLAGLILFVVTRIRIKRHGWRSVSMTLFFLAIVSLLFGVMGMTIITRNLGFFVVGICIFVLCILWVGFTKYFGMPQPASV